MFENEKKYNQFCRGRLDDVLGSPRDRARGSRRAGPPGPRSLRMVAPADAGRQHLLHIGRIITGRQVTPGRLVPAYESTGRKIILERRKGGSRPGRPICDTPAVV